MLLLHWIQSEYVPDPSSQPMMLFAHIHDLTALLWPCGSVLCEFSAVQMGNTSGGHGMAREDSTMASASDFHRCSWGGEEVWCAVWCLYYYDFSHQSPALCPQVYILAYLTVLFPFFSTCIISNESLKHLRRQQNPECSRICLSGSEAVLDT